MTTVLDAEDEYNVMTHEDSPPALPPPRAGAPALPPPRGSRGHSSLSEGMAAVRVNNEQIYVTDEILSQPWFAGKITRFETEKRLKSGGRAGNFLVRQKDDVGHVFVHSYLSLTRMMIIHNLIEFQPDGTCTVDQKPWPHEQYPSLEDVIDKMQEIRRKRKGMKQDSAPDPRLLDDLDQVWPHIFRENEKRGRLGVAVRTNMQPGGFMVCRSTAAGPGGFAIITKNKEGGYYTGFAPNSPQGYYLKYSELIGNTPMDLIINMLENGKATMAAGFPCPLRIPTVAEAMKPLPTKNPSLPPRNRAPAVPPPLPRRNTNSMSPMSPPLPPRNSTPEQYYEAEPEDDEVIYGTASEDDDIYGE
eukprot:m.337865 g.337865  ORF g.337865 m.337865 type:complete len:359 (-) comp18252_c0_seq1:292-1368(-)